MSAKGRVWLVEGRNLDGEIIHRRTYPLHWYSDQQMGLLLQAMASKSALSYDEIANALCRRDERSALLEIQNLGGDCYTLACGPSLDWTARVLPDGDPRLKGLTTR